MRIALWIPLALAGALAAQTRPAVAVAGIMHESNSFNPAPTRLDDFTVQEPAATPDILQVWRNSHNELTGYLEAAADEGLEIFPALHANAMPKGPLTRETFETLLGRMLARIRAAPRLDGVLLALHGALIADGFPLGDEEIVRRVREAVGPRIPIVVTHDFHANVSPAMLKYCTALVCYQQNPHLDTRERGQRAARILARTLRGEIRPVHAVRKPPMAYNLIFQNTYRGPFAGVTRASMELEKNPKVLAASVVGGYQWGDTPAMGPAAIVVTDGDPALAEREAARLADLLWQTREQIVLRLPDPAQAVRDAMRAARFPVSLMDTGDNIGGGSAGDSTFLLAELLKQKAVGWVMAIADPEAVQAAIRAGIGGAFDHAVGGKTDDLHGKPVRVRGRVRSLHDGEYLETETRHGGGRYFSMGLTAVIEVEGSTPDDLNLLQLTTRRVFPSSLHQLISCGIDPSRQRILVAKGTIAPLAAYEPVSAQVLFVDSPGSTAVNPARFRYRNLPPNLWGVR
jgi:microcystin degradation protein MlrC